MKITTKQAGELLGTTAETIRIGLQMGIFDFGVAFKPEGKETFTYIIYPEILKKYVDISLVKGV